MTRNVGLQQGSYSGCTAATPAPFNAVVVVVMVVMVAGWWWSWWYYRCSDMNSLCSKIRRRDGRDAQAHFNILNTSTAYDT